VTFWWSTLWQVESRRRSQPGGGFFTKMLLECREIPAGKLKDGSSVSEQRPFLG
jgi:hypothetical protein